MCILNYIVLRDVCCLLFLVVVVQLLSRVCPTHAAWWTVAHQASLSMVFPRQEYWNGLLFPTLGDLPDPGIKPVSPALAGRFFTAKPPGKPFALFSYPPNKYPSVFQLELLSEVLSLPCILCTILLGCQQSISQSLEICSPLLGCELLTSRVVVLSLSST